MNSKGAVLQQYPYAYLRLHEATFEKGRAEPTASEYWAVYPFGELGHLPLGTGNSPDSAWEAASKKVNLEERHVAVKQFIENVMKLGFQWTEKGARLVDPSDADSFAEVNWEKGNFTPSPKLHARHAEWDQSA